MGDLVSFSALPFYKRSVVFLEEWARPILIAHAVVGAALVAATTHLALWMRRFPRGDFSRIAAGRRFSRIAAGLYVASFVLGNTLYPSYKTRVRAEHLDEGASLSRDWDNRERSREAVMTRYQGARPLYRGTPREPLPDPSARPQPANLGFRAARLARWFDVKEHWVALGMAMCLALAVIVHAWNPKKQREAIAGLVLMLAVATAAVTWFGAIVGLTLSSFRSVGPLS